MYELIVYDVLPNGLMFGGLYLFAKKLESMTWEFILWQADNYYSDEGSL
jgi:hypothetical protein